MLLMGNFNISPTNPKLNQLIDNQELRNLISEPKYFKSISSSCADNFLTNKKAHFMKTVTFETGIPHHHKPIVGP